MLRHRGDERHRALVPLHPEILSCVGRVVFQPGYTWKLSLLGHNFQGVSPQNINNTASEDFITMNSELQHGITFSLLATSTPKR